MSFAACKPIPFMVVAFSLACLTVPPLYAKEPVPDNAVARVRKQYITREDVSKVLKGWDVNLLDLPPVELLVAEFRLAPWIRSQEVPILDLEIKKRTERIVNRAQAYVKTHAPGKTLEQYLKRVGVSEKAFLRIAEREAVVKAMAVRAYLIAGSNFRIGSKSYRKQLAEIEKLLATGDPWPFELRSFIYAYTNDPKWVERF